MASTVAASASVLPTASTEPPIAQIIPVLRTTLAVLRVLVAQASRLVLALATPLLIFLSLLSHLLAPFILAFQVILDATVYTPYAIISSVTAALYPLYILCGVACISGAVLGVLARSMIALTSKFIAPPPEPPMAAQSLQAVSKRPRKRRRKSSFTEDS